MSNSEAKIRRMKRRLERRYPGVTVEILHRDDMNDPSGKLRNIMFTAPDKESLIRFGLGIKCRWAQVRRHSIRNKESSYAHFTKSCSR